MINNFKKMKKVAFVLEKVFMVLFWCFIAIATLLTIAEVVISLIPASLLTIKDLTQGDLSIVSGMFQFDLGDQFHGPIELKPLVQILLPVIILTVIFYLVNFKQLQSILRTVRNDRPFDEKNAKSLWIMSINFILASVILHNAGGIVFSTALKMLHFSGVGLQVSIGYTNLFIGILLMVLSGVFQYGNNLQEEFDETV
ncbi:MAG: DUF2975 domain-containing protein [Mobilitalea sp.]